MTIWEFEVFSWSAFKTNKGDLLIKLDFHSGEKSLAVWFLPLISIVAQSWKRSQMSPSPPAKRQIQHLQPPKQQQEGGNR